MEEYLKQLQTLVRKPDLTSLDIRDGIIAAYVVISRLNQLQGNPDIGLKQTPPELARHIKGCMAAFFWEQGFNFENPTPDHLIETKIMTDSITQVYAMPENLQIALNEVIDLLVGRFQGQSITLSPEVQTLIDPPLLEENRPEPAPQKQPKKNKKTAAEPVTSGEAPPTEKKPRRKKKKATVEGQEKPKRRNPRQNKLKIDLSSIQMPNDFMLEKEEPLAGPAPQPFPVEETPLAGEEPNPAPPTAGDSESMNDAKLLSKLTLDWQPETEPLLSEQEPASLPEDEPASVDPGTASPVSEAWDPEPIPEPPDIPEIADNRISFPSPEEPVLEPSEEESGLGEQQEEIPDPEAEPSSASRTELEESEMEKSEYFTPESDPTPESQISGEADSQTIPQMPALVKKKGGLLAMISMLLLGLILGAGGSYYWFGIHEAQVAQAEIEELQQQLAEANHDLETAQTELATVQEQAQKLNEDLDLQREASLQPVAKPKYIKSGRGVVLYWLDKEVVRKYYFYRAKGRKARLKKISDQPMSKNIMYLKKVSPGTWRYAVSAVDMDGEETDLSEVLKLRFPLR